MRKDGEAQCTFTLDVTDAAHLSDLDGDTWQCPHTSHRNHDVCLFHLSPSERDIGPETVSERMREIIETQHEPSQAANQRRFLGATFEKLDFRHVVLDGPDTHPIDVREAQFVGPVDFSHAVLGHPIRASGATFEETVRFTGCETSFALQFDGATFEGMCIYDDASIGSLDCQGAVIEQLCRCRRTTISGDVTFANATIEGLSLERATIADGLYLHDLACRRRARLDDVTSTGVVSLSRSQFKNGLWATQVSIKDDLVVNDTRFDGATHFQDATVTGTTRIHATTFRSVADFRNASFQSISLNPATVTDELRFDDARFDVLSINKVSISDNISLENVVITNKALLENISFHNHINCKNGEFDTLIIDTPVPDTDCGQIDLRNATIENGRFGQSETGLVYNLERATLGTVTLDSGLTHPSLQWYRFLRTDFVDFDFSSHKLLFAESDWQLHFEDDDPRSNTNQSTPTFVDLEVTYLKAKAGASATGDSEAASRFYRKEMQYRRLKYLSQLRHDPRPQRRLKSGTLAAFNLFMGLTTGHGELPRRVLLSSVGVIGSFALIYWQVLTPPLATGSGFVDYLALSTQIFLTFLLGTDVETTSLVLSVTAAAEGFIGAFFVALFVFTLTRSIKR